MARRTYTKARRRAVAHPRALPRSPTPCEEGDPQQDSSDLLPISHINITEQASKLDAVDISHYKGIK